MIRASSQPATRAARKLCGELSNWWPEHPTGQLYMCLACWCAGVTVCADAFGHNLAESAAKAWKARK